MANDGKASPLLVQQYFRVKARQLAAMADLPVCEHNTLAGSHREELQRIFLQEVLPRRFAIGRGMVYGPMHRSKEADVVIWDAQNFPSLPMLDHSFFFAESVRLVLECKSQWKDDEFEDVLMKCEAVRDIITLTTLGTLDDRLSMVEQRLASIETGQELAGMILARHHIGTAAIFLRGGSTFMADSVSKARLERADDRWPDILLLLEPGRLVLKSYESEGGLGGSGFISFFDYGPDALCMFTNELLERLADRSVQVEEPFYLRKYLLAMPEKEPTACLAFQLTRPLPTKLPIHWGPDDYRPGE
jgi:hypothetical protein